jgi:hypothetical protein
MTASLFFVSFQMRLTPTKKAPTQLVPKLFFPSARHRHTLRICKRTILDAFEKRGKIARNVFDIALFSLEECVLIDLQLTLKKLGASMKANGEVLI